MRSVILGATVLLMLSVGAVDTQNKSAAVHGFERLKALEGEWIDADGTFGAKGAVAVTYKVTGGGNAVVETFPVNRLTRWSPSTISTAIR